MICAGDCDDADATVYPSASEICDGKDNNCDIDGLVDEDQDGDGYGPCEGDCKEQDPDIGPVAQEECDGIDNDCDEFIDEGFEDADGDGWAFCTDCDEEDPDTYPGAEEICDLKDNDCDESIGEGEVDLDGDGYVQCSPWEGDEPSIEGGDDCDDADPLVNPGYLESLGIGNCDDGKDNDCDGLIDDDDPDCTEQELTLEMDAYYWSDQLCMYLNFASKAHFQSHPINSCKKFFA